MLWIRGDDEGTEVYLNLDQVVWFQFTDELEIMYLTTPEVDAIPKSLYIDKATSKLLKDLPRMSMGHFER